jgi:hypothetical protein
MPRARSWNGSSRPASGRLDRRVTARITAQSARLKTAHLIASDLTDATVTLPPMARQPFLDRLSPAHAAAVEHVLPLGAGFVVGVFGGFALPCTTRSQDFFAVSAQVIPVLLLALAIEARVFGGLRRRSGRDPLVRGLETLRVALTVGLLAVFIAAELHALKALGDASGERVAWLENVALAWGVMTVGAIAIAGVGRARLTATLK